MYPPVVELTHFASTQAITRIMDSVTAALHTIRLEAFAGRALLWSALIVPLIAALVGWAAPPHGSFRKRAGRCGTAFIVATLYSILALVLTTCGIGDNGKQQLGRALAAPVITALERYHAVRGVYPDSLLRLVPTYVDASVLQASERSELRRPFGYTRFGSGFVFSFYYIGPGSNTCDFSPGKPWSCHGLF